jgi:hypothetical protein
MSQAVIALIDVTRAQGRRENLRQVFDKASVLTLPVERELGLTAALTSWQWTWNQAVDPLFEEWLKRPNIGLWRPGAEGLRLAIGTKSGIVSFGVSWVTFLTDARVREGVRAISSELARATASALVIYLPDSGWALAEGALNYVFEGKGIETISMMLADGVHSKGSFNAHPIYITSGVSQVFTRHDLLPNYYLVDRFDR